MNTQHLVTIVAPIAFLFLMMLVVILPRRIRMERRARELLAQHPDAEQTSVDLQFYSPLPWDKQREMDAKKTEMEQQGWTFLRARWPGWLGAMRSWGGAVTLHFIRTKV